MQFYPPKSAGPGSVPKLTGSNAVPKSTRFLAQQYVPLTIKKGMYSV